MKTLFLLLIISITSIQISIAQTVTIPDSNFEQALVDLGYDTNGITGDILQVDAEAVTTLNVNGESISSLDGIEGFINLEILECFNNQLTSLDVSNNVALEILKCNENQLENLLLGNNPALVAVNTRNNNLSSLNLSSAVNLVSLNIFNNNIESIDLSIHSNFEFFLGDDNNLTSLNLSNGNNGNVTYISAINNPDLTCVEVDNALFSIINWTSIDPQTTFSENCNGPTIAIPDVNFEQVLINLGHDTNGLNGNILQSDAEVVSSLNLISLSISDLTGIAGFTNLSFLNIAYNDLNTIEGVENLTNLESLQCHENNLTNLELSNLVNLKILFSGNNPLGSLDVSNNALLETLNCASCQLTTLNVNSNSNLFKLQVFNNQLSTLNIDNNLNLEELDLSGNQMTSIDLSNHVNLTEVYATDNALTSLDIKNGNNAIIEDFEVDGNPNLDCIQVDDFTYSSVNWTTIDPQTSFSEDCNYIIPPTIAIPDVNFEQVLIDLGFDTNGLNGNILQSEAEAVIELNIPDKNITSLEGIEGFVNLLWLYCGDNNIETIDVSQNSLLVDLSCDDNQLTNLDVSNNTDLTYLDCSDNNLTSLNINNNIELVSLFCTENNLTSLNLSNNPQLFELVCPFNQLSSIDVSSNTVLKFLYLMGNNIATIDLSQNPLILGINCDNNQLTSLNLKNGFNGNISTGNFSATNNPDLICIEVDDVTYSETNWTEIDPQTGFSEDCAYEYTDIIITGTVSGLSYCADRNMAIFIYDLNTSNLVHTSSTLLSNGMFDLMLTLNHGHYDIYIKIDGYLSKGVLDVELNLNTNQIMFSDLTAGDINNDDGINIVDVSSLAGSFNLVVGHLDYSAPADINCDDGVNIIDASIMSLGFGQIGEHTIFINQF